MNWSPAIIELLALHSAFMRLGYPISSLFVVGYAAAQIQFQLKWDSKTFTIDVPFKLEYDQLQDEWPRACEWWTAQGQEERQRIYEQSKLMQQGSVGMMTALVSRGLYPIKVDTKGVKA